MKLYKYLLIFFICFGSKAVLAQQVVSGIIKDGNEPAIGVTVREKAVPANGVSTDADGKFRLILQGSDNILIISGIGYLTQEVNVKNKSLVTIQLETDNKTLQEVVVVGYGTQTKLTKTGAISSISREEIRQTPSASLQNTLNGKVTGFVSQQRSGQPGSDGATFYVRGVSTFNGAVEPLILVDDIEYSYDQFSRIDPNEVETITILKDAATTAIYGIKGANGVILVTTRRGTTGAPKINFRTEFGLQMPTNVPKFLNAYQTATLRNEALVNEGGTPEFTDADLEHFRTGDDPYGHPDIDWYETLFKKSAPINTNNLDLSGGTETVKYFISGGFLNQGGIMRDFNQDSKVKNDYNYKRYNFRSNLDIKATKSLSFKIDLTGNYGEQRSANYKGSNDFGQTAAFMEVFEYERLNPYIYPITNPDGSYGWSSPNRASPKMNNIIGRMAVGGYRLERENFLNLNLAGVQKLDAITKGLSLRATIASSNSNSSFRDQYRADFPSFYYDPVDKSYTPRDASIFRISPWNASYGGGNPIGQLNVQSNLTYARSFGNHSVNGLFLYNQTTKLRNNNNITQDYVPDNFRGYTARVGYNFKEKYLVELNGAYNGSDRFIKHYGFFPAVSAGWNIAEEGFIKKNLKFMELFKLRGSYGIVGSDNAGPFKYVYEETYRQGGAVSFGETHNNFTAYYEGNLANKDVTWEKERKANVGIDFSILNGKISGTAEYFDNFRYDILTPRNTVSSYFGLLPANLPPLNIGEVSNKGYEIELGYKGNAGKVGYRVKGNVSVAENKIVFRDEAPVIYPWTKQTGQSIGVQRQYIWEGFYTQEEANDPNVIKPAGVIGPGWLKYKDLNGDGIINDLDQAYTGDSNIPRTNFGLNLGVSYKNFTFNALVQAAIDYDLKVHSDVSTPWKANLTQIHLKRWTPETAGTAEFPALISNFVGSYMQSARTSTFWMIPGDYVRLRSLEVAYKLPATWIKRIGLRNARLYASGYNLLSFSKSFDKYGFDPEVLSDGGDRGIYPVQAIYNMGISVSLK